MEYSDVEKFMTERKLKWEEDYDKFYRDNDGEFRLSISSDDLEMVINELMDQGVKIVTQLVETRDPYVRYLSLINLINYAIAMEARNNRKYENDISSFLKTRRSETVDAVRKVLTLWGINRTDCNIISELFIPFYDRIHSIQEEVQDSI